jgi:filamentous hemagglutinin
MVNGLGFINTSRATLTTGTPVFGGSGSLDAFRVTGGQILVQGAGMNAANVDQVDLIARAVQANASLYANRLNVIAGANQVDHDTLGINRSLAQAPHQRRASTWRNWVGCTPTRSCWPRRSRA